VCQQLDLLDLVRVAETCKRFRHGGLETLELPTESPVVTAMCKLAFPRPELVPSTRPSGCSESWVAYLARGARQRRFQEAPPVVVGDGHSLFADAAGRLLACGMGQAAGQGEGNEVSPAPTPVAAMFMIGVRSLAAGGGHSLAVGWDGRVYSWGNNAYGQLGHGDTLDRPSPALMEGLEGVRGVAAAEWHSCAVTQSGDVFLWGRALLRFEDEEDEEDLLRPVIVEGFGGLCVRRVYT
jgi:hypothetical protein